MSAGLFVIALSLNGSDEVPVKLFNEILFLAPALTYLIDPDSGVMVK